MGTKFLLLLMTLFVVIKLTIAVKSDDEDDLHPKANEGVEVSSVVKMRCTRRFSPGSCVEDVAPVWTFVFLAQNCTERLGCPSHYTRTNRFRSYRACMRKCRALVEMYLQMVMVEDENGTDRINLAGPDAHNETDTEPLEGLEEDGINESNLRLRLNKNLTEKTAAEIFRSGKLILDHWPRVEAQAADDEEEEEYKEEQETNAIVYKDLNINEDIVVPDVDYIGGEFRSEFDVLHW